MFHAQLFGVKKRFFPSGEAHCVRGIFLVSQEARKACFWLCPEWGSGRFSAADVGCLACVVRLLRFHVRSSKALCWGAARLLQLSRWGFAWWA